MARATWVKFLILPVMMISVLTLVGCGSTNANKVCYGGFIRSAVETQGALRLAQDQVTVVVDGKDETAVLYTTGNYFVVFAEDLIAAVKAMKENIELRAKIKELEKNNGN